MKKKNIEKLSYDEARHELEEIISALQNETVNLDEMSSFVKRAVELINYCRKKLRTIETDLAEVLDQDEE